MLLDVDHLVLAALNPIASVVWGCLQVAINASVKFLVGHKFSDAHFST
jgi:hypothetical protein